jgi:hypothetical protein
MMQRQKQNHQLTMYQRVAQQTHQLKTWRFVVCSCSLCLWFVVSRLWFMVCGLWFVFYGLWFVVCGLWFLVCGLWFVVCSLWLYLCSLLAVCGLWFVVCGLWFVVCGLWFVFVFELSRHILYCSRVLCCVALCAALTTMQNLTNI